MNKNTPYNDFLGKIVNIGVPHFHKEHRLFFITGLVTDVEDGFITLEIKEGIRRVPFSDIIEITRRDNNDR